MFTKKKVIVTHSGDFHADDAFSVAAFSLLHKGNIKVIRSRNPDDWARGDYVVDVGDVYDHSKCRYDHHQRGGAGARPDGVPYAGFGLVWRHYGAAVCGSQTVADRVERLLVEPIDAGDNGFPIAKQLIAIREYPLADAIGAFCSNKEGADAEYSDFMKASEWAKGVLSREIARCTSAVIDTEKALLAYKNSSDKRIIVMDEELFWIEALHSTPDALFAVYPDSTGKWRVKAVQEEGFRARKNLPESWAGLRDNALVQVTGVPDAEFAHTKRFMAVAKSREGALALARKALEA